MSYNFTESDETDYSTLVLILCIILLVVTLCCTFVYTYFTFKLKRTMHSYDPLNTLDDRPGAIIQADDYTDTNSQLGLLTEENIQTWLALPQVHPSQLRKFLNGIRVGAHRGLALDAPENTLAAFKLSKILGADSVEFDLEFTKEGVPVVLHDDTVDRTTDGSGSIRRMLFSDVQKLNAAAKFVNKEKFPREKVPTLQEFIELCLEMNVKIFFDLKNFHPTLVGTITELFKKNEILYERAAICSFYPQVVYAIKRADPKIITGHTWRPWFLTHKDYSKTTSYYKNDILRSIMELVDQFYVWSLHKWVWKITGANLILTEKHSISSEYVKMWRERGLQVVAWTVNDYHEKLYYLNDLKCPFLTDKLSDIQKEMKETEQFCNSKDCPTSTK